MERNNSKPVDQQDQPFVEVCTMGGGDIGANILSILFILLIKAGPIVIGLGGAIWLVQKTGVGRSLLGRAQGSSDQGERLLALEGELARLREELAEVQERQDFAERLLTPDRPLRSQGKTRGENSTPREVTPVS